MFISFIAAGVNCVLNTAQECGNDPEEPRVPKNRCGSRAGHFDLLLPTLHRISILFMSISQTVISDNGRVVNKGYDPPWTMRRSSIMESSHII